MNSKSSYHAPVEYLRWCWGAYLGLSLDDNDKNITDIDFHSLKSYTNALNKCKWFKQKDNEDKGRDDDNVNNFTRLITPQLDLPPNIHDCEVKEKKKESDEHNTPTLKPPIVIVSTSRADPLRDDGVDFVRKLKMVGSGENIVHFDVDGSHAFSMLCYKK